MNTKDKNLIESTSTVHTTAVFSKDATRRYLLSMSWDDKKKKVCIIMTYPSTADSLIIDQTTMLCRNNAVEQDYGSISIVNLFCTLDTDKPESDRMNASILAEECDKADLVIIAYGRGTAHTEEKDSLLTAMKAYKNKLYTIVDSSGQPFSHPLSPRARSWKVIKLDKSQ